MAGKVIFATGSFLGEMGTTGGGETVSYSLVGLGSTGGTYQEDNNFGID